MPPKQRITREMIMERAFDMFCREGMDVVNARSVAKALGCSTQPIFSYYTGMQELRSTLDIKAQEMFTEQVLGTEPGDCWLLDLCEAYVRFACEHPHVHRHLYSSVCEDNQRLHALEPIAGKVIVSVAQREGIDEAKAQEVCRNTVVYTAGLAAVAAAGCAMVGDVRTSIENSYRAYLSEQA